MLPFENRVADYVKLTKNHVYYEVTPIFDGNNLVADGVHIQAYSIEDNGVGVSFNVFCYNVQPGVVIDYATGDNKADTVTASEFSLTSTTVDSTEVKTYVVNIKSKKFHNPNCDGAKKMNPLIKNNTKELDKALFQTVILRVKNAIPKS